jgi:hypothetical protein
VEVGFDAVKPWGALGALFIGRGAKVRGSGRQDGGSWWAASMVTIFWEVRRSGAA